MRTRMLASGAVLVLLAMVLPCNAVERTVLMEMFTNTS